MKLPRICSDKSSRKISRDTTEELTEAIAKNFKQFYEIGEQLIHQIELKDKKNKLLEEKLTEYEKFLKNDLAGVLKDELMKNPTFKKKYDEITNKIFLCKFRKITW